MAEWNQLNGASPRSFHDENGIEQQRIHEPPCVPFCCGHFVKANVGEESPIQRGMIHGLAMDIYGRATIGMSSIFLGPALLSLANQAAGCDDCTIRGFGRPSSLLTNMAALSGFLGCIALPFFGSIIDHTSLRKSIGLYTGIGMIVLKTVECMALRFPKLWLYIAATQIASSVTFYVHLTASYAYLSELSTVPSEQSYYNTSFFVIMYASTLIFMIEVLSLSSLLPDAAAVNEDVRTARLALVITVATCAPCFLFAWLGNRCFPHRPAIRNVPTGQSVYSAGFYTLRTTVCSLSYPLRCVLASVALSESAANAIIAVSTTYMKQVLQMNAQDIGIVFFIVLLSGVPGSQLGRAITAYSHNPVLSLGCCNLFFVASTLVASMVLRGPEDRHLCTIFGFCWGLSLGWLQPQNTSAYIPLLPSTNATQVTEMMGLYVFASQILSWLPPTVFTIMNESQISMSFGLGSLSIYFLVSLGCLYAVGDYPRLVAANRPYPVEESTSGAYGDTHEMVRHHQNGNATNVRSYAIVAKDEVSAEDRLVLHELT